MKNIATVIIICVLSFVSCQQQVQLTYKYADKEQAISCATNDSALLNEALHTFEEALLAAYDPETRNLSTSYGRFIYRGFGGDGEYTKVANTHAFEVRDALIAANILIQNGDKSNLNYNHPAVACVIDKIQDAKLKKTINNLLSVNSMDPTLLNDRLRNVGRQVSRDRHIAMYAALDGFYQHLVGLQPSKETNN